MSLASEIEEFRRMINTMTKTLEEVNASSATIPQTAQAELSRKFTNLMEGCNKVSSQMNSAKEKLAAIKSRWG